MYLNLILSQSDPFGDKILFALLHLSLKDLSPPNIHISCSRYCRVLSNPTSGQIYPLAARKFGHWWIRASNVNWNCFGQRDISSPKLHFHPAANQFSVMQKFKAAALLRFGTIEKGHPSSYAPYMIGWGLTGNHVTG